MRDFAVLSYDFGYNNDPNLPGGHDPNSERSDLTGDHRVDLDDIAVMADLWLVPVFDEYRICSLCNIGQTIDPNEPDSSGVIDVKDYQALMADWGKEVELGFSASFYDKADQSVEPNLLSGVITVQVDEYPVSSWVFAKVDGISAGVAYPYNTIPPTFEIPTYEFSNGNHTLSLGGYTYEGGCWMREIPVQFNNPLYLASIPERYEPDEVYEIWGYFDGGTMQISTDPNTVTISDSGYICHSTMINTDTAEASLYHENGEFSESQYIVLAKAVDMSKVDPNSFRALIVAPDIKANKDFEISLTAIRNALLSKNISYQELLYKDATWENISIALQGGNLNYVYWIGHSDSQIGETRDLITLKVIKEGVHRTNFKCWKKGVLSDSLEDRIFSCLASDKITKPAVPELLPDNWEKRGHSMWSLKLWQTMRIKEFWVIGCESGLEWENAGVKYNTFNDMACAVGACYKDNQGNYVHVYIGTRKPVWFGYLVEQAADYPSAIAHIIQRHSNNHNLEDALNNGPVGSDEHIAIWGREGIDERSIQWWPLTTKRDWIIFN